MLIGLLLYLQKINKIFIDVNLRAMLAEEYLLAVPFAYQLQPRRDEYNRALEYNLSSISLLNNIPNVRDGLK